VAYDYSIIVIGAGAAGLVVAIGAARAGRKVLLIEKGNWGGDCTNFGCIPSKSTIAAANSAYGMRHGDAYGLKAKLSGPDATAALERTRRIVQQVREHEEPEALQKAGVATETGTARFLDPHTLEVGGKKVTGKQIVIATGSSPVIPKIEGIEEVSYLTNESIFHLKEVPEKLGVIGGGPIGCELAQAYSRLGAEVSVVQHAPHLLAKEIPEAQKLIEERFQEEGIELFLDHEPVSVSCQGRRMLLNVKCNKTEKSSSLLLTHLLISAGRAPHIEELDLEKAGVRYSKRGVAVDRFGRSSRKNIWAVGDVAGRGLFTHLAENEARAVLTSLLLPGCFKKRLDRKQPIPRVTYTDPEVAHLGLTREEALEQYGAKKIAVYTVPFEELDRAITAGRCEGFVTVVTKKWSSKILGATIVAERAGEMLMELSVAMNHNIPLRKLASLIHPYPTFSLAIRKAADQWLTKTFLPLFKKS